MIIGEIGGKPIDDLVFREVKRYGGRSCGKTYESIMLHVMMQDRAITKLVKRVDELEKHVKEIDMDVNDLFDDVEGKYEDNNKQSNTNNRA